MKHTLLTVTLILATAASAWAQDKPPVTLTPPQAPPSAEQELQAIQQLCGLADYASRIQADGLCQYFIKKYTDAVATTAKPKAAP